MHKFSKYNIFTRIDKEKVILYNCLTGAKVALNNDNFDAVLTGAILEDTESIEFGLLCDNRLVIDESADEDIELDRIEEAFARESELAIIFIATKQCNFRCVYCYERFESERIEQDIYDAMLQYIFSKNLDRLSVGWFGGEPLLEYDSIVSFMSKTQEYCKSKGIALNSSITTNGYLLDIDKLKMLLSCGVKDLQITVDGLMQEHDVKRVLATGRGTFERIWSNLKTAKSSEESFCIVVRYNIDARSDVEGFLDFYKTELGDDERFVVSLRAVGGWTSDDTLCAEQPHVSIAECERYAKSRGIRTTDIGASYYAPPMRSVCYANRLNSFVVLPKGKIAKCTVESGDQANSDVVYDGQRKRYNTSKLDLESNIVGQLEHDGTLRHNSNDDLWSKPQDLDKCVDCIVKPMCMSRYCPLSTVERDSMLCRDRILNWNTLATGLSMRVWMDKAQSKLRLKKHMPFIKQCVRPLRWQAYLTFLLWVCYAAILLK